MAHVKLNPVLEGLHGKVGDLVFKQYLDQTVVARKPDLIARPPTPAQQAVREKFRLAALYGKAVMADPVTKTLYTEQSKKKGKPAFALMVADFCNAPVVDEIDVSTYTGMTGDKIRIRASDDFEVTGIGVRFREDNGDVIDEGAAVRGTDNVWTYTAGANVPQGHSFVIEVTATDRPGHKGTKTQTTVA